MAQKTGSLSRYALSIMRMVVGFTFAAHGAQKLFGMFGGVGGHGAKAALFTMMWTAGVLEFFGGLLILAGLFTRPVAFLLCGEMAVAYFRAHFPEAYLPIRNGGELAVLYCFVYLFLCTAGAGPISIDGLRGKA